MKKFQILLLFILISSALSAQKDRFEVGIRIGLQNHNITPVETISVQSATSTLEMSIEDIDYGFHAGIYSRIKAFGMYIEPAVLLNSQSITYNITSIDMAGAEIEEVKKEYYQNLDIPVLLGFKIGFVKIHAGPVAHIHLSSTSELFDYSGYDQRFKDASFGYQAGIGLDFKKIRFQVNYEGNFTNFGNHIMFEGESYSFSETPSRLIASVGVAF